MKVGDIKIDALRLMFAEIDNGMTAENVGSYDGDAEVGDYLRSMPGSIRRSLLDLESRRILPERSAPLKLAEAERVKSFYRFDLSTIKDFYDVSRVTMYGESSYEGDYPYRIEGNTLILISPDENATFNLLYYPRVKIPSALGNGEVLEIPDEIAALIPYFIKGELYRQDEINDAAEAMSWYEQRLALLAPKRTEKQSHVSSVYSQVML